MVVPDRLRPRAEATEVVGVELVAPAEGVADAAPLLADERAPADCRPGRALVEVDTRERAREAAVLDDVTAARQLPVPGGVGPLGGQADADSRADAQAAEDAVLGE